MEYDPNKPRANNGFAARGLFNNRELYKEKSYPHYKGFTKPIDLWYTHGYYGRLDNMKNAIEPRENHLTKIPSENNENLQAFHFVADAFKDLREYINIAGGKNVIETTDTKYYNLQPYLGWVSANLAFERDTQFVYDAFFQGFMADKVINDKLVSFASFHKLFSIFIDRLTPEFAFSKTAFVLSARCSPLSSGLMLELAEEPHGDDKIKYTTFIQDPNFDFFVVAAQRFGFIVDKNAPWRIVADIGSSKMKSYMANYNLTLDNIFQMGYAPTYLTDIPMMQQYLIRFYNSYVSARPEVRIEKPSIKHRNALTKIIYKRVKVNGINPNEFDDAYWLTYYAYIRAKELNRDWRQVTFNKLIETARQLNKFQNYSAALEFLNKRLRGPQPELLSLTSADQDDKLKLGFSNKSYNRTFKLA